MCITAQRTHAIVKCNIRIRILLVEQPLDAFHYHIAGIIVYRRQEQRKNSRAELGYGIAFSEILLQDFKQAAHDIFLLDGFHGLAVQVGYHNYGKEHGGAEALQISHLKIIDFLEYGKKHFLFLMMYLDLM